MAETIKAYMAYRRQRKNIQMRQRGELEAELLPWKRDLGDAIRKDRETLSLSEIAALIDNKNKNFLYEMLKHSGEVGAKIEVPVEAPAARKVEHQEWELLDFNPLWAQVSVFDHVYELRRSAEDMAFTAPDEWANGSDDERQVYRAILRGLNN